MKRLSFNRLVSILLAGAALFAPALPGARAPEHGGWNSARAQATDDELVYIDEGGFIRTKDFTAVNPDQLAVVWASPVGGYVNATLIDVQGDGDMEIAGLRIFGDLNSLDIYDPVISSGDFDPAQTIGGIPWTQLYSRTLSDRPLLIAAGNLDASYPGDELFFTEDGDPTAFLRQVGARDGRTWEKVVMTIPDRDWNRVALGDMNVDGLDEVALVQNTDSALSVWRMLGGGNTQRLYEVISESRKWQWPAMGKWRGDGRDLLGVVRLAAHPWPTFIIYRFSFANQEIVDDHQEVFSPGPRFIMFGDVNGNGDDEAFMLRELPANDNRARLIGRNRASDPLALTEDPLDFASAYLHGATGDIDGDGKDEVILVGRGKFRYYLSPDTSSAASDEPISTNQRTLLAGDLDAAGYLQELVLQPSTTVATSSTPAGGQAPPVTVNILNGTNNEPIAFSAALREPASWLTLTVNGSRTPASFSATFDSTRLAQGTYIATVVLTSPNPLVFTQPVEVQIRLIVGPGLLLVPDGLAFVRADCAITPTVESKSVLISAPAGSGYTVAIVEPPTEANTGAAMVSQPAIVWPSGAAWVEAQSATALTPENLIVTVDYAQRSADFQSARAIVSAVVAGSTYIRTLPITLFCADKQALLPLVRR